MSSRQKIGLGTLTAIVAIGLSIGGVVYSAGYQGSRIDNTERRTDRVESRLEQIGDAVARIEGKLDKAIGAKP